MRIFAFILMLIGIGLVGMFVGIGLFSSCPPCTEPVTTTVYDTLWLKPDVVWPETWPDDWPENLFWVDAETRREVETDSAIYHIRDKIRELRKVDSSSWIVHFIRRDSGFTEPRGHRIFSTVAEQTILSADTTCYRFDTCGEGEL